MNLVDAYVTRVLSTPRYCTVEHLGWWEVRVEYNNYGRLNETDLVFNTQDEAAAVCKGYKILV